MQYSHGQVRQLFDRIAHRYDLLNRLLSLGIDRSWRARMIRSCSSLARPRILDIATGTGDVLHAARALSPRSLTGIDLSRPMLERARRKSNGRAHSFIEGIAESLPFRDGSFDLVLVAFGVRNFSDRARGLREMRRVLRQDGHARILDFSRPSGRFMKIYALYFHRVLPAVGGLLSGHKASYAYLPASVMEFPSPEEFSKELSSAGFTNIRWTSLTRGIVTLYEATAD